MNLSDYIAQEKAKKRLSPIDQWFEERPLVAAQVYQHWDEPGMIKLITRYLKTEHDYPFGIDSLYAYRSRRGHVA